MTESTKALAIAAGLAGVAGAATLAVAPNQVSASTGTVTYADGATTVWQTPAFKSVKRYVVKDQNIAILGQKTINGTVWYQIGAGEWIPEIYLQVSGTTPAATTANAATAKATTTAAASFAVQATYTEGAVTIWNGTNYTSASGKYLTTDSNVTAVATVQANGETWYKLSDGGYVPARFAAKVGSAEATAAAQAATKTAAAATTTQTTTPAAATTTPADTTNAATGTTAEDTAATAATAAASASTSTTAAPAAKTTTPATTTATQTTAAAPAAKTTTPATPAPAAKTTTATAATTTPAAAAKTTTPAATTTQSTATPKTNATTATASQSLTVTYTDSVVTEWKSAGYTQTAGKYLAAGTTVTAVGTTTANGETWYQLSDGNYVSGRFFGVQGKANSAAAKAATTTAATTQTPAASTTTTAAKQTTTQASTPAASTQTSTPAASTATSQAATSTQAAASTTQSTAATQTQTQTSTATTPTNTVRQTTAASANGSRAARIAAVISVAKAQLGKPYVWGGKGPNSFDCSGLTHYAFLNGANKEIGGYTGAQQYAGTVVSIANLQVGDLVFWGSQGATYHVAIYLGGNQYIAAPQPGENVKISSISSYFMPSFGVRVL